MTPFEHLGEHARLHPPERPLADLVEDLGNARAVAPLDLLVERDDGPREPLAELRRDRRLPGSHEADEREVHVERVERHYAHSMRWTYAR